MSEPGTPSGESAGSGGAAREVRGDVILYRLFDVGYAIQLGRAFDLLASSALERRRPVREGAQTIQIPNPPVTVALGALEVSCAGGTRNAELSARIFDFGLVSLRARVPAPPGVPWEQYTAFGSAVASDAAWGPVFDTARRDLLARIAPSVERPGEAPVSEDYVVYRVTGLHAGGARLPADALSEEDLARALLGETRPLSRATRRDLLSPRFSYFEDDLAVVTWNSALVLDPEPGESDVEYVLEFANAQLLELRFYDDALDRELPMLYARISEARRGFHVIGRGFGRLLVTLHTRVADATEVVERVENSLKVTQDVFLARLYATALEIFGGRTWRGGIDRKLGILRDAYVMLNAEAQAMRAEALEIVIVVLIVVEIAMGFALR